MRTTVAGGVLGAAHGGAIVYHTSLKEPTLCIATHAQTGAILGPWFPIVIPIWLMRIGDVAGTECPVMKGGNQKQTPEFPTVAEKP